MDVSPGGDDEAFRRQLRAWLRRHAPRPPRLSSPAAEDGRAEAGGREWHRRLHDAGYLALDWPRAYGGEACPERHAIVEQELARHGAPPPMGEVGLRVVGPVLIEHGSEEQRRRFLPPILHGDEIWCAAFAEPNAGADPRPFETVATLEGDGFVVEGEKIASGPVGAADWVIVLARTALGPEAGAGLACFLLDLRSPGVEVQPIAHPTGRLCSQRIRLRAARVPRAQRLGDPSRSAAAVEAALWREQRRRASPARAAERLAALIRLAGRRRLGRARATRDPILRQRLAALLIDAEALRLHGLEGPLAPRGGEAADPSGGWLEAAAAADLENAVAETALDLLGEHGLLTDACPHAEDAGLWPVGFFCSLAGRAANGPAEISKLMLARAGLGMRSS